ncbi:MAG: indolepyruvate oxidoreductase subunit beta [Oscillospiraceae bacterium]|jgi:indolepyruvate ferredoxin oxidoreductase beta subunit|nr:indolepyruvate oxidoreductase subunit beta [Oscillospiraceae bacterium]
MEKSIMFVGVGGQGSLLASRIMGTLLVSEGYDVKVSEVHGMSQRGGSVVTYVKYGKEVQSPVIEIGEADILLSFELLEGARWLPYLKKDGKLLTSSHKIPPMSVITGACEYPENIAENISNSGVCITALNARELAVSAGNPKCENVVMLGVLSQKMDISETAWNKALEICVPPKFLELNKKAFELGRSAA